MILENQLERCRFSHKKGIKYEWFLLLFSHKLIRFLTIRKCCRDSLLWVCVFWVYVNVLFIQSLRIYFIFDIYFLCDINNFFLFVFVIAFLFICLFLWVVLSFLSLSKSGVSWKRRRKKIKDWEIEIRIMIINVMIYWWFLIIHKEWEIVIIVCLNFWSYKNYCIFICGGCMFLIDYHLGKE